MSNQHIHSWFIGIGSDDKPCNFCFRYPELSQRHKCTECQFESCRKCALERIDQGIDKLAEGQPSSPNQSVVNIDKLKSLEFRVTHLENAVGDIQHKLNNALVLLDELLKARTP